jgi:tyrosine-protein phosphatase SIW14
MKLCLLSTVPTLVAALALGCSTSPAPTRSAAASADTTLDTPMNFAQVTSGIYRGGHPDEGGLLYLQSLGVTTIIDLEIGDLIEATPSEIDEEIQEATALGLNDIREPMSAFEPALSSAFDAKVMAAIGILADPTQKPVYVHCAHGQDRTGLVIGLERVLNEGWAPSLAWQEMLAHGFHVGFLGLDDYFFRKTGWTPLDGSDGAADAGNADAGTDAAGTDAEGSEDASSDDAGADVGS